MPGPFAAVAGHADIGTPLFDDAWQAPITIVHVGISRAGANERDLEGQRIGCHVLARPIHSCR